MPDLNCRTEKDKRMDLWRTDGLMPGSQAEQGIALPTNQADRSMFVRFLVKVVCADHAWFSDEPIEVDFECAMVHFVRAVYNRAVQKWPDVHPVGISACRGNHDLNMIDLRRSVRDVLPMAYNGEFLTFELYEAPLRRPKPYTIRLLHD